jgi:ATP-dependent protease ClpP protease subunit
MSGTPTDLLFPPPFPVVPPPQPPSLKDKYPGGCFIGINAAKDRRTMEQLVSICTDAMRNGFDPVMLCMSSIGGFLDQAYYAFNMLEALPIKFVTHNVGSIQSAGNILFLVGDERYAAAGATFFFHQTAFDTQPGQRITEAFASEKLKAIEYDDSRSASVIANKTGKPVESVREWQNTELVMDTAAAIEHGIVHEIRTLSIPANAWVQQVVI